MADESVVSTGESTVAPPSTPAPVTATPVTSAQPVATPQAPQAPATGAPEVEPSWLRGRLNEVRQSAARSERESAQREIAQIRAEAERYQAQVRALTGQAPPPNPEIEGIKTQFGSVFPGLSKLEQQAAQIEALLERAGDFESQNDHYWSDYGRRSVNNLFSQVEKVLGVALNDEAKQILHSNFTGFVSSSPERTARYANDPTIVDDFVRTFTSSFIDPARRVASATVAGRAASNLPQDTPSGTVRQSPVPQPANLDERVASAWQQYNTPKS